MSAEKTNVVEFPKRNMLKGRTLSALRKLEPPPAILPGYIVEGINVIYGMPKRGKSFFVIDVTVCYAAQMDFHGTTLGSKHGRVLYVAGEGGAAQITKRVTDLIERRGFDELTVDCIEMNWHLVDHRINLLDAKSIQAFIDANPGRWDIIVIDTLARNMDGDENSTQDMNDLIAGCDALRTATGATIILIHHCGKDGKLRGSSALYGALDTLLLVSRGKDGLTYVRTEDARDFELPEVPLIYRLVDGVLESVEAQTIADTLTERETAARSILVKLCANEPRGVSVDQWRAAVEAAGLLTGKSAASKRTQWGRLRDNLFDTKAVKWSTDAKGSTVLPHDPGPADDFAEDEWEP